MSRFYRRVPRFVVAAERGVDLERDPAKMELRIAELLRARWAECGHEVTIWRDGPWTRSDLVAGLPRAVWEQCSGETDEASQQKKQNKHCE